MPCLSNDPILSSGNATPSFVLIRWDELGRNVQDEDVPADKEDELLQRCWMMYISEFGRTQEVSTYMDQQKLSLARQSRDTYTEKIRYQRLRIQGLEMMKAIVESECEETQVPLAQTECRIGQIRAQLYDKGGISACGNVGQGLYSGALAGSSRRTSDTLGLSGSISYKSESLSAESVAVD